MNGERIIIDANNLIYSIQHIIPIKEETNAIFTHHDPGLKPG